MNRRDVIKVIFGPGFVCPKWLERLLLGKHSSQIKETPNYSPSARSIIERLLDGADKIDEELKTAWERRDRSGDSTYGFYLGLEKASNILGDDPDRRELGE